MNSDFVAFGLKNLAGTLLLYPSAPILLMIAGLLVWRRRPRLGRSFVSIGVVIVTVFSLPVVANAIAGVDESAFPPFDEATRLPPDTAIVVLGGGMQTGALDYGGETVNPTTLARLRSAARLQAATGLPILVTGGRPPLAHTSEAALMADALINDFHAEVRWREERALDTADNARFSAPMLTAAGIRHAVVVTDVSHMRRALVLFAATGIDVISAPTDYYASGPVSALAFLPQGNAIRRSSWAIHEWVGTLWARLHAT